MVALTLKERLMRYMMKRHSEWVPSGELQRIVAKYTTYSPANVTRRLRELEVDGKLEVQLRKNHAWYRSPQRSSLKQQHEDMIDLWNNYPQP